MVEAFIGALASFILAPLVVWGIQAFAQRKLEAKQDADLARRANEITIHRVTENDQEDASGIVSLYNRVFDDDGTNYSPEELLEFLTKPIYRNRHLADIENIILVAKHGAAVIGFLFCHFYPERKKAIISYYAIDRRSDQARIGAAAKLMARELHEILSSGCLACNYLFFDIQNPDPSLGKAQNLERRARPALFKLTAESLDLRAYRLHFDYRCPRVSLDPDAREYPFTLLCIPLHGNDLPALVPRSLVVEFIRFVYLDCYGDIYPIVDPRFKEHHGYLESLVRDYERSLPDFIHAD